VGTTAHAVNCIRAAGAVPLATALEIISQLTSLNLGHNQLEAAGAAALAPALATMTQMTSLDLGSTRALTTLEGPGFCAASQLLQTRWSGLKPGWNLQHACRERSHESCGD
jgi:hypothetical protein